MRGAIRIPGAAAALAVLLAGSGSAGPLAEPPDDLTWMMFGPLSAVIPIQPLKKERWEVRLAPSYVLYDYNYSSDPYYPANDDYETFGKLKGGGLGVAATYGIKAHHGISLIAAFATSTGKELHWGPGSGPQLANESGVLESTFEGDQKGSGVMLAATGVYDPFTKPDGFRLPIIYGLSFFSAESSIAHPSGSPSVKGKLQSAGTAFGIAPSFRAGDFRIIPFYFIAEPFDDSDVTYDPPRNAPLDTLSAETFGIDINYLPANLGFTILFPDEVEIPFVSKDATYTSYTMKLKYAWGGA